MRPAHLASHSWTWGQFPLVRAGAILRVICRNIHPGTRQSQILVQPPCSLGRAAAGLLQKPQVNLMCGQVWRPGIKSPSLF